MEKVNCMNILIPTDLSEASLEMLPNIIHLFQKEKVNITLFHAVEPIKAGSALVLKVDDIIFEEAKTQLDAFVDELNQNISEKYTPIKSTIHFGYFEQVLNQQLSKTHPDLVLMNSKSRNGIDKILNRKKTLQFIGEINQPLLIVPNEMNYKSIHLIGVAVDQKEPLLNETITKIENLSNCLEAKLSFFHVNNSTEKDLSFYNEDIMTSSSQNGGISVLAHEEVPVGIEKWMAENNAEILAMVTHDKGFFERLFKNGMTRTMAKRNSNMLLIISQ